MDSSRTHRDADRPSRPSRAFRFAYFNARRATRCFIQAVHLGTAQGRGSRGSTMIELDKISQRKKVITQLSQFQTMGISTGIREGRLAADALTRRTCASWTPTRGPAFCRRPVDLAKFLGEPRVEFALLFLPFKLLPRLFAGYNNRGRRRKHAPAGSY